MNTPKHESDDANGDGKPETAKKMSLEDLPHEELIKKCRAALNLAQKAKNAKAEFQAENERLTSELEKFGMQRKADKDSIKTLQELVESLTDKKLKYTTELDSCNNKVSQLQSKCKEQELNTEKLKADLIIKESAFSDLRLKLSDLDSENLSYKRQIKRLEDENEQLINQLAELESKAEEMNRLGLQQREQLSLLEETTTEGKIEINEEVIANFESLKLRNDELEQENKSYKKAAQDLEIQLNDITRLHDAERAKFDRANIRLKSYKDKIVKCSTCITQLKNSKYVLLKTVKDYSESIPKWQNDILKLSALLSKNFTESAEEIKSLKNQIVEIEEAKNKVSEENKNLVEKMKSLSGEINQIKQVEKVTNKAHSEFVEQIQSLKEKIYEMEKANSIASQEKNELTEEIELLKLRLIEVEQVRSAIGEENMKFKNDIEALQSKWEEFSLNPESSNASQTSVEDSTEALKLHIKAIESEKSTLLQEKTQARDKVCEFEAINNSLSLELNAMQNDLFSLRNLLDSNSKENTILKSEIEKYKTIVDDAPSKGDWDKLKADYDQLIKENKSLQDLNNLLKEEVETLKSALERPSEDAALLNESLQADLLRLETKLSAYKHENSSLLQEVKETRPKLKEVHNLKVELEEANAKLATYKKDNAELLHEMKEINQALKERGENISKQQKAIAEMEALLEQLETNLRKSKAQNELYETQISEMQSHIDVMKKEVDNYIEKVNILTAEKEMLSKNLEEGRDTIGHLRDEIERLKLNNSVDQNQNDDTMSTSTISRAEEQSRMKDLDESFEEKYSKLRLFAVKLKKRVSELQIQLAEEQEKNKSNTNGDTMSRSQELQNEIQKLKDALESKNKETANLDKENGQTVIDDLRNQLKVQSEEIERLIKASENVPPQNEDVTKVSIDVLQEKIVLLEQELAKEKKAHSASKDELAAAKRSVKKKSVLSLEMEDYERSMKELTSKMENNKKKIQQMESTIETHEATISSLKTQVKLLEDQVKAEENQHRLTKEELHKACQEVKEKENDVENKEELILKMEKDIEMIKQNNEDVNVEMTTLLGEAEKKVSVLFQEKTDLIFKVKKVENQNSELDSRLRAVNIELEDLKTEFTTYKVRAQAVLRQNQTVDHSAEEQTKEENASLKAELNILKNQFENISLEMEEVKTQLSEERRKAAELSTSLSRANQRCRRLEADALKLNEELDAAKKQHSLQVATLTTCYKTQMAEQDQMLRKDIDDLKQQVENLKESCQVDGTKTLSGSSQHGKDDMLEDMELNVAMLPREEGEGSEFAPSPPPSKSYSMGGRRSPLPLERLLEEGVPEDEVGNLSVTLGLSVEQELAEVKRKLHVQTQRCRHVTALLSESERECARLSQLNEVLKAEVRRASHNLERTTHAHNAEYMKNVTLKFLTLPAGDERLRLVPVLQKILTLTHDETSKLSMVAKGADPNSNKGWGSYLPWPGGGGNGAK